MYIPLPAIDLGSQLWHSVVENVGHHMHVTELVDLPGPCGPAFCTHKHNPKGPGALNPKSKQLHKRISVIVCTVIALKL